VHNHLKDELHDILSGKSQVGFGAIIQTIACYLSDGTQTGSTIENTKHFKEQETKKLENYIHAVVGVRRGGPPELMYIVCGETTRITNNLE